MSTPRWVGTAVALAITGTTALAQTPAGSQAPSGRLTYEQAWKVCTPFAQQVAGADVDMSRYIRAAACMKHYGHNI